MKVGPGSQIELPANSHVPFERGKKHIPAYYKVVEPNDNVLADADVIDIANAFQLSYATGNAVKYLLRAGKKPGESAAKDLTKALEVVQRELMRIERNSVDTIEVDLEFPSNLFRVQLGDEK